MTAVSDAARITQELAPTPALVPPVPREAEDLDPPEVGARARRTADLLARYHASDDSCERTRLREEVVGLNMPLARSVARRYRDRGIGSDDLDQVAYVGLMKAVNGFNPAAQADFHSYAVPTMRGEVRRHFRDFGWTVRPPRRLQELQQRMRGAAQELTQALGHSPKPSEIAEHLAADVEDVVEALACNGAYTPSSLDLCTGEAGTSTLGDRIGTAEPDLLQLEDRLALAPAVRRLTDRDRRIIRLRYFEDWTQQQIGEDLGISQVQVSRTLARIMRDLRNELTAG